MDKGLYGTEELTFTLHLPKNPQMEEFSVHLST